MNMGEHETVEYETWKQKYIAAMVLGAVGDALGYFNGHWEFLQSGDQIHKELEDMGGLHKLEVCPPNWIVSDDTVMHNATGRALVSHGHGTNYDDLFKKLAREYKECMDDMNGRAPGPTCIQWCEYIDPNKAVGWRIPFNPRGGGCGAAMRAMCIGLRYPHKEQLDDLIKVSIEAGRMTHHHPTGYLGSLASALLMSYAVQGKPVREWGASLLTVVESARKYITKANIYTDENICDDNWCYFTTIWTDYLRIRNIEDGIREPQFLEDYATNVKKRDQFYKYISYNGWGGSSGHDAPLIAYDAVLACKGDWKTLCEWGMFHGGDSDSTGIIAGSLFGALYGFNGVPEGNHSHVEKLAELVKIGEGLCDLSFVKRSTDHCENEAVEDYKDVIQGTNCEEETQRNGEHTDVEQINCNTTGEREGAFQKVLKGNGNGIVIKEEAGKEFDQKLQDLNIVSNGIHCNGTADAPLEKVFETDKDSNDTTVNSGSVQDADRKSYDEGSTHINTGSMETAL